MHEAKLSISSKGKAREDTHWQLGWWDLEPLTNSPPRAIAWSKSSVIFTPHTTQPLVLARHFPTSRQFVLPSPASWPNTPTPYEPPSIITVSPTEDWLFAYFAGLEGDGAGCLWRKGQQLDSWTIQEWWTLAKGNGVIAAEWLCGERDWLVSEGGQPYRLPPRGPILPSGGSALIIITQAHQIHVCTLPPVFPAFKILRVSLLQLSMTSDGIMSPEEFPTSHHGGQRVCKYAAIGINYNDHTIWIATRSCVLPTSDNAPPFNTLDLGLHLDIPESGITTENLISSEWEQWGEESTIELYTVVLRCTGQGTVIRTVPVPPLKYPGVQLTALRWCAVPPEIVPPSPTITRDPRRPVKDGLTERGSLHLVASSLDFGDYTSLPRSQIKSFTFPRSKISDSAHECIRDFGVGTVAFLASSPSHKRLTVGFLDSSGVIRRHAKAKEVPIGSLALLNPADLTTDNQWESAHILAPVNGVGRDIPVGIAVSPNRALICSISPSVSHSTRTTAHSLPRQQLSPSLGTSRTDLARSLVSAILSRKSPSDVVHALSTHVASMEVVLSTLSNSLTILETYSASLSDMWLEEILGVAAEVYLDRAQRAESEEEKELLKTCGETIRDFTSIMSLNSAFQDCREGDAYDLSAIWQLVGLSVWFIDFSERVLRECVYIGDDVRNKPEADPAREGQLDRISAIAVLNIVHPYTLSNFLAAVNHVKRLYDDLKSLTPKTENAQMARDVFMDAVDGSGVRLDKLGALLQELKETKVLPPDELKKSLLGCMIPPLLQKFLHQAVDKLLSSDAIDRLRLFVKPADLMDGVSRLSISEHMKEKEIDIITKGALLHTGTMVICVRCGGRSEMVSGDGSVAGHVSESWNAWEHSWSSRCVCGGAWIRPSL